MVRLIVFLVSTLIGTSIAEAGVVRRVGDGNGRIVRRVVEFAGSLSSPEEGAVQEPIVASSTEGIAAHANLSTIPDDLDSEAEAQSVTCATEHVDAWISSWIRPPHDLPRKHAKSLQENIPTKVIFLNARHPLTNHLMPSSCPVSCEITKDTSLFSSADAVVWNPRWIGPFKDVPATKPSMQKWVFTYYFEAPFYSTHIGVHNRMIAQRVKSLNNRIDWSMTFGNTSDIFWPMIRLVPALHPELTKDQNFAEGRQHLMLWFVSDCGSQERMKLMNELKASLPPDSVHVYGRCGQPSPCPRGSMHTSCFRALFAKYKFYAAFENSLCDGYITEKFALGLGTGIVPLVFGGMSRRDYERIAPADSFLYSEDFKSTHALADRLLRVNSNDTEYNQFFAWRSHFDIQDGAQGAFCELCQKLHRGDHPTTGHADLFQSWYDGKCRASSKLLSA